MTADDRWDERLNNWAMWYIGGGDSTFAGSVWSLAGRGPRSADDRAVIMIGEALDTDSLIRQLERVLQTAIITWYVSTGTLEMRARDLACHPNTLRYRVDAAKTKLEQLWQRRPRPASIAVPTPS